MTEYGNTRQPTGKRLTRFSPRKLIVLTRPFSRPKQPSHRMLIYLSQVLTSHNSYDTTTTMILSQLTSLTSVIAPPPGIAGNAIAALQLFAIATSYSKETSDPTPYSKFAADKKLEKPIPSQNGMFRIYVPSTIAAAIYTAVTFNSESFSLVSPLLFAHFLKRTLEVAFVHRYSGSMPATSANGIGGYYTFLTLLISLTAVPVKDIASQHLCTAGLALFAVGELGNLYHHYLLSTLRSSKEKQ